MFSFVRKSILLKLLLILAITAVLINTAVFSGVHYFMHLQLGGRPELDRSIDQFGQYLLKDIGIPPSPERARALSEKLGLGFRLVGPGIDWASPPRVPTLGEIEALDRKFQGSPPSLHRRGYLMVDAKLPQGPGKFIVVMLHGPPRFVPRPERTASLILVLTLILVATFFVMRKVLGPLVPLTEAVEALGRGDFDHTVPVRAPDELGKLAAAFNEMAGHLKEMIHAKEQLLLDVSHELRTPLTKAKLALEFVRDEEARGELRQQLDSMEHMVKDLLEDARLTSGHGRLNLQVADVVSLVSDAIKIFSDRLPEVKIVDAPDSLRAEVDEERMKSVIRNIVENAMKYSPTDRPVEIRIGRNGDHAVVRVIDRGAGIPAAELERVFEPFYRVDKSRTRKTGGYGLGLALCRRILRAHRGEIVLQSNEGQGTTAIVTFPLRAH